MNLERVLYRASQFWHILTKAPAPDDLEQARLFLPAAQYELFLSMPVDEQAHALKVFQRLRTVGETHPDLLRAALLHDVGKSRFPMRSWERALVVLGKAILPEQVIKWSQTLAEGWRRPFVVAEMHPAWGAELARSAGASDLEIALIRRHQDTLPGEDGSQEDELIRRLQDADNAS